MLLFGVTYNECEVREYNVVLKDTLSGQLAVDEHPLVVKCFKLITF